MKLLLLPTVLPHSNDNNFTLGEDQGSQGGKAAFEGRIIVMEEGGGVRVTPLDIFDDVVGDNNDDDHDGLV